MAERFPKRLVWAAQMLAVKPDEQILEIGCGRGVAVQLICPHLRRGRITGIDRSEVAVAAAEARNRACVEAGRARFVRAALADAELEGRFDRAFAVNVNAFWQKPARELAMLEQILAPSGSLYLFYEPPSSGQLSRIETECVRQLSEHGFQVDDVSKQDLSPLRGLCIVGSLAP